MEARYKAANNWPVYIYLIDYFNEAVFDKEFPVKGCFLESFYIFLGSFHGYEYPYLFDKFNELMQKLTEFNEEDKEFQRVLLNCIIEFIKTE